MPSPKRYTSPWGRLSDHDAAAHMMDERTFVILIGAAFLYGTGISLIAALLLRNMPYGVAFLFAGILAIFAGVEVADRTKDWLGSLAGHTLSSAGLGAMAGPWMDSAEGWPVRWAFLIGMGILGLTLLGILAPRALRGWGGFGVGVALGFATATMMEALGAPLPFTLRAWDYVGGLLFLAYIDVYWSRALDLSRTLDNAVDTACAVYLAGVNQMLDALDWLSNRR